MHIMLKWKIIKTDSATEGVWNIWTTTGPDPEHCSTTLDVGLVLCGENGESKPELLRPPVKGKVFQPGAEEHFQVGGFICVVF